MAKGRADVSFQAIADAIAKVENTLRKKDKTDPHHLQLLGGLRAILEAYCLTQRRPADCGDYCFLAVPGTGRAQAGPRKKTRTRG
jgi:hypothetical protein